jgi:hypothetical protein
VQRAVQSAVAAPVESVALRATRARLEWCDTAVPGELSVVVEAYDRDLSDLVGELATHSEAFRTRWAAHDVRFHNTGVKRFHHPVVGELTLSYNRLDLAADHGLAILTYAAEPGSRSDGALKLLGSWAATVDNADSEHVTTLG